MVLSGTVLISVWSQLKINSGGTPPSPLMCWCPRGIVPLEPQNCLCSQTTPSLDKIQPMEKRLCPVIGDHDWPPVLCQKVCISSSNNSCSSCHCNTCSYHTASLLYSSNVALYLVSSFSPSSKYFLHFLTGKLFTWRLLVLPFLCIQSTSAWYLALQVLTELSFTSTAAWLPCSEAYSRPVA